MLVAASFLLATLPARAQNGGVMFVTSANPKNAAVTGKEGSRFIEVKHAVVSPRDPQSGLPTGQRQSGQRQRESGVASGKRIWQSITIVKEKDSASPKLFQAFTLNEGELRVKLELNPSGKSPKTIELQDARITNIHNVRQGGKPAEEIELTYQKIEVTYSNGKKSYADDWEAR
jgi:type VI secretion system secreted protein Hcp